jgi:predicted transcriptional regulator
MQTNRKHNSKSVYSLDESAFLAGIRRSRMEVKIDILQAIKEGAGRPTHIMYRSNLSWSVMQGFIRTLEIQGLVKTEASERKKRYLLTEKGERVLKTYLSMRTQFDAIAPIPVIKQSK